MESDEQFCHSLLGFAFSGEEFFDRHIVSPGQP